MRVLIGLVLVFLHQSKALTESSEEISCVCTSVRCAPCEVEEGTTFYTAKCGPDLKQVKSCQKRTCVKPPSFAQCMAELKSESSKLERAPASEKVKPIEIGRVVRFVGSPNKTSGNGEAEAITVGTRLYSGDQIETHQDEQVAAILSQSRNIAGNEVLIDANTSIRVDQLGREKKQPASTLIHLYSGRMRARVMEKLDGRSKTFRIETKTAVAGVRGTDFVTSFYEEDKKWITKVQTLEGQVFLGKKGTQPEADDGARLVRADEEVEFVTEIAKHTESEPQVIEQGNFSAREKISLPNTNVLKKDLNFAGKIREPSQIESKQEEHLCRSPAGQFGECSYTCEGTKAKTGACKVLQSGVSCVRRVCRANGKWMEATRLPSHSAQHCASVGITVKSCASDW